MKILFLGNSATFVHEIPQKLQRLCEKAGYKIETAQLTPSSFYLREHADESTEHGKLVLEEIKKGYDIVFLQENSTCIVTEEKREACRAASAKLAASDIPLGHSMPLIARSGLIGSCIRCQRPIRSM